MRDLLRSATTSCRQTWAVVAVGTISVVRMLVAVEVQIVGAPVDDPVDDYGGPAGECETLAFGERSNDAGDALLKLRQQWRCKSR